ncbi:MAG: hypothetical protein AVDCRST_MAG88-38, partial [uncultured Thermomicrobiales bacterium]
ERQRRPERPGVGGTDQQQAQGEGAWRDDPGRRENLAEPTEQQTTGDPAHRLGAHQQPQLARAAPQDLLRERDQQDGQDALDGHRQPGQDEEDGEGPAPPDEAQPGQPLPAERGARGRVAPTRPVRHGDGRDQAPADHERGGIEQDHAAEADRRV